MYNQKDTISIMFAFANLKIQKQSIIKVLLNQKNAIFVGNYTDFTKTLGLKTGINGSQPNIRKAILELEKQKIVEIEREGKKCITIRLTKNWIEVLKGEKLCVESF